MSAHDFQRQMISRQEIALFCITAVWGATFLIVHMVMRYSGVFFFVGLRFTTAGLFSLLIFRKTLCKLTVTETGAGIAIGASIFLGYALQTYGLRLISSSTSAFLTALYVPIVPLFQWLLLRRAPKYYVWIGVLLSFAGLVCMAGPTSRGIGLGTGEVVTLISAFSIAAEILLIGRFAKRVDSSRVTIVQLLVAGLLSFFFMLISNEKIPAFSVVWLAAGIGLGIASALIQLTMNWAQKSVSPSRATLIYASEPVWAGIIGQLAGDRFTSRGLLGAVMIFAGVIASEIPIFRHQKESR